MKIIYVPIERIPTRYTADWVTQFEAVFNRTNTVFITVGDSEVPIESGSVLDVYGTNLNKLVQLQTLITMLKNKEIQEDDVILFADAWFPGIESLFYIRNMSKVNFKIAGIFHAGTWDPYDFTSRNEMRDWGQHLENSWLNGMDLVFVATQFHKDLIVMNSNDFDYEKIFVTGIPFYGEQLRNQYPLQAKENIIVFPHRLDDEKHPEKFDRLKKKYPQWTFIKTLETTSNRDEYFKLLARSKVMISYAEQETFGYSTVEAMALGNYVIVPNALSYRETVPDEFRYSKEKQIELMIEDFMSREELPQYPDLIKWEGSIDRMIRVINVKLKESERRRIQQADEVKAEQLRIEVEKRDKKLKQEEKAKVLQEALKEGEQ